MVGTVSIREVLKLPVEQIWEEFESTAFIKKPLFDKYFEGLDHGYALVFGDVKSFSSSAAPTRAAGEVRLRTTAVIFVCKA